MGSKTVYDVSIGRDERRIFSYYTSVRPQGQTAWYETRVALTLWGARRNAKKMIREIEAPLKQYHVEEYEVRP
jgi:hypothetical protein